MIKFSSKLKKTCFWSIWGGGEQKNFHGKSGCHAQLHMGFQHYAKFQKKLKKQFKENTCTEAQTEGWTEPIL